jgi:hypothetical protein
MTPAQLMPPNETRSPRTARASCLCVALQHRVDALRNDALLGFWQRFDLCEHFRNMSPRISEITGLLAFERVRFLEKERVR